MRYRVRRQLERSGLRSTEVVRLAGSIVMLAVVAMLIVRAGDARMWRWLVGDGEHAVVATSNASDGAEALPAASGPTDEDAEQQEAAREEFQAITDGTLTIQPEEMEAYKRLLAWVGSQSFDRLEQRAHSGLLYTQLHDEPEKYRGKLVALDLYVRRALDAETKSQGVALHEVWGFTAESGDRPYVVMAVDLPKEMPVGPFVKEKTRFCGYLLKLQGYHPTGAKAGQVPETAPLLIGRLQWHASPVTAPQDRASGWWLGLAVLAIIALVFGGRAISSRVMRNVFPKRTPDAVVRRGEVIPIEQWLDQAGFGQDDRTDE